MQVDRGSSGTDWTGCTKESVISSNLGKYLNELCWIEMAIAFVCLCFGGAAMGRLVAQGSTPGHDSGP